MGCNKVTLKLAFSDLHNVLNSFASIPQLLQPRLFTGKYYCFNLLYIPNGEYNILSIIDNIADDILVRPWICVLQFSVKAFQPTRLPAAVYWMTLAAGRHRNKQTFFKYTIWKALCGLLWRTFKMILCKVPFERHNIGSYFWSQVWFQ